jgi:hypothetical protein
MKMQFNIPRSAILGQLYLLFGSCILCTFNTKAVNLSTDIKMRFGSSTGLHLTDSELTEETSWLFSIPFCRLALYIFCTRRLAGEVHLIKFSSRCLKILFGIRSEYRFIRYVGNPAPLDPGSGKLRGIICLGSLLNLLGVSILCIIRP